MIVVNGQVVAQGAQFSIGDVEVVTATIDLEDVRSFRTNCSRGIQASTAPSFRRIEADHALSDGRLEDNPAIRPTALKPVFYHTPEEEIRYALNDTEFSKGKGKSGMRRD